jgi:hypothetical protein
LRKASLVRGEKRGYWTHYSVERSVLRQLAEALMEIADQAPDFRMVCPQSTDDTDPSCVPKEENQ